jgi:hypothetical protein
MGRGYGLQRQPRQMIDERGSELSLWHVHTITKPLDAFEQEFSRNCPIYYSKSLSIHTIFLCGGLVHVLSVSDKVQWVNDIVYYQHTLWHIVGSSWVWKEFDPEPWDIPGSSSLWRLSRIVILSFRSVDTRIKCERFLDIVLHWWKQYKRNNPKDAYWGKHQAYIKELQTGTEI